MKLITQEQQKQMLKNGLQTQHDHIGNHWPVVKLFIAGRCRYLVTV